MLCFMKVIEIWRYPVKSMAGEQISAAFIGKMGIPGDRAYALRQDGITRNAKKFPQLMSMRAYYPETATGNHAAPTIMLEDGTTFDAKDPSASDYVSRIVGADVTIQALEPADNLEFYKRTERRTLEESRAIFGLEEGEPFPDVSRFPRRIAEFSTPPGTFFDCYPLLIMTTASLAALQAAAPASNIDVRRFRPNILIDTDREGFIENAWSGRTLTIGAVEIVLTLPCPRCVMTTVGFHDLPRDTGIMRTLVRNCKQEFGIYGEARVEGRIHVGDEVSLR